MQKIFPFFFFILAGLLVPLFLAPFFVRAEQAAGPYARYCHGNNSDIFTGIAQDENGRPRIEVSIDPDFEVKTLRTERQIRGLIPLTPVYDLRLTVVPVINEYCLPEWDSDGQLVKKVDPPPNSPFQAKLIFGDSAAAADNKQNNIVGPAMLTRGFQDSKTGEWRYIWHIKGWPSGISGDKDILEKIIAAAAAGKPLSAAVRLTQASGTTDWELSPIAMSNCVPVWGSGRHKIKGMYSAGSISADKRIVHFDKVRLEGFASIEPLKSSQSFFSYFVDLYTRVAETYNPRRLIAMMQFGSDGKLIPLTQKLHNSALLSIMGHSTCGDDGVLFLTVPKMPNIAGIALYNHQTLKGAIVEDEAPPKTYVHEFGHTFALLGDETYKPGIQPPSEKSSFISFLTNCSISPGSDYRYQGKLYGGGPGGTSYLGCGGGYEKSSPAPSLPVYFYYRPSHTSIMNKSEVDEFNIVSCGYILSAIKGGDAKSYFPECATLPGVIRAGQSMTPLESFFSLFSGLSNSLAQVGSAVDTGSTGTGQFLILDSFDPNNPGAILEVVPDNEISPDTGSSAVVVAQVEQAAGPYLRYCSGNHAEVFTGVPLTDSGAPDLELSIDPAFEQKTLRGERHIGGRLTLTPVYDLVLSVYPLINEYCLPEWDSAGEKIKDVNPPSELPFNSMIALGDKPEGAEVLVPPGTFTLSGKDSRGFRYERKIKGWPSGIAPEDKLEKLVKAIAEGAPVSVMVEVPKNSGGEEYQVMPVTFSLCVPVWGFGKNAVVYGREARKISIANLIHKVEDVRISGFEHFDPLKKYKEYFTHIVDIGQNRINYRSVLGVEGSNLSKDIVDAIKRYSSGCSLNATYIIWADIVTKLESDGRVTGISSFDGAALVGVSENAKTVIHEFGHAFGKLFDEYGGGEGSGLLVSLVRKPTAARNCAYNPLTDFAYGNKLYGEGTKEDVLGCNHVDGFYDTTDISKLRVGSKIPLTAPLYRPSPSSIMNYEIKGKNREPAFNVVSCGYLISAIKKEGSGPEYFLECMGLDTVKPSGVTSSMPQLRMLAGISGADTLGTGKDEGDALGAVVFERDVPAADGTPAAGLIWYDGDPPPPLDINGLAQVDGAGATESQTVIEADSPAAVNPATGERIRATGGAASQPASSLPDSKEIPSGGEEPPLGFKPTPPQPLPVIYRVPESGVVVKAPVTVPIFLGRVRDVFDKVIPFIVGLAVFFIIWQIFIYITRAADEEKRAEARLFIVWGILGVFFMLSIWGFVNILVHTFQIPGTGTAINSNDIPKVPDLAP